MVTAVQDKIENQIETEYLRLKTLLGQTPRAQRETVERFHAKIKEKLDSGAIIPVPSQEHRTLHQLMWITGHEVYNGFHSLDEAVRHFCISVRGDFNVWYAKTYLNGNPRLYGEWANVTKKDAEKIAKEHYHLPLDKVVLNVN